jgi:hypothetical protein
MSTKIRKFDENLILTVRPHYDLSKIPWELQRCSHSHHVPETIGQWQDWAVAFCCKDCNEKWFVCDKCDNTRKRCYTLKQLQNHKSHHVNKRKKQAKKAILALATMNQCRNENNTHRPPVRDVEDIVNAGTVATPISGCSERAQDSPMEEYNNEDSPMAEYNNDDDEDFTELKDTTWTASNCSFRVKDNIEMLPVHMLRKTKFGFADGESERYFQHVSRREPNVPPGTAGVTYLVKQSLMQREYETDDDDLKKRYIPEFHVTFQMMVATQVYAQPRTQVENYLEVLKGSYNIGAEDGGFNMCTEINDNFNRTPKFRHFANDYVKTVLTNHGTQRHAKERTHSLNAIIPDCHKEAKKYLTENKFSIIRNLPYPRVKNNIRGHAYVSIVDCVRDYLGHHGLEHIGVISPHHVNTVSRVTDSSESTRACQIRLAAEEKFGADQLPSMLVSYLKMWSDDCDVNSSSMQGRANVWLKTLTIASPHGDSNRRENTYLVAVGEKDACHDAVERQFAEDLRALEKESTFYVGPENKTVRAYFGLLATLADQPERRSSNRLLAGNSNFLARMNVSADHHSIFAKLKACKECLNVMLDNYRNCCWDQPFPVCSNCLNWDVLKPDTDLSLVKIPTDYPNAAQREAHGNFPSGRVVTKDGLDYLRPFKISYQSLKRAVDVAHMCYTASNNSWSKQTCRSFLTVEGLNNDFINEFQKFADNALALSRCVLPTTPGGDLGPRTEEERRRLLDDALKQPHKYQRIPYPNTWMRPGQELDYFLEVIMHLIFLGCVKNTQLLIQTCLTAKNKNTAFVRDSKCHLLSLLKMNLEWAKVRGYCGNKFYGWNSENYLGFARIMPWFYQNVSDTKAEKPFSFPPEKDQRNWTMDVNRKWLSIRKLNTKGKSKELRERVAEYLKSDRVPLPVPEPNVSAEDIEGVVVALQELLECIMCRAVTEELIQRAEYAIRIYLSVYENVDGKLRAKEGKSSLVKKYNFMALMNLPSTMVLFGPLRCLWEGGMQGEGYIKYVKEQLTQGLRKNWAENLLKNVQVEKSLHNVFLRKPDEGGTICDVLDDGFLRKNCRKFKKYRAAIDVSYALNETSMEKKGAVSVLVVSDNTKDTPARIFAVVFDFSKLAEIKIRGAARDRPYVQKFGLFYHKFDFVSEHEHCPLEWSAVLKMFQKPQIGYALLLPLLDKDCTEESRLFTMVSSNWTKLDSDGCLHTLVDDSS